MAKLLRKTVKTSLGTIVAGQPLPDDLPKKEAAEIRKRGLLGDAEVHGSASDDDRSRRVAEHEKANAGLQAQVADLTAKLEAAETKIGELEEAAANSGEPGKPAE
jgi:hypothetical protein